MRAFTKGPLTGRHAAAIFVLFFGVVMAVNFTMARFAGSTFGGVVVENSYVASQNYNRWLDEAAREQALGWEAQTTRTPDGRIALTMSGTPPQLRVNALARHPLGRMPDQALSFDPEGEGRFVSTAALPAGRWRLRVEAAAGEQRWRKELDVR